MTTEEVLGHGRHQETLPVFLRDEHAAAAVAEPTVPLPAEQRPDYSLPLPLDQPHGLGWSTVSRRDATEPLNELARAIGGVDVEVVALDELRPVTVAWGP